MPSPVRSTLGERSLPDALPQSCTPAEQKTEPAGSLTRGLAYALPISVLLWLMIGAVIWWVF